MSAGVVARLLSTCAGQSDPREEGPLSPERREAARSNIAGSHVRKAEAKRGRSVACRWPSVFVGHLTHPCPGGWLFVQAERATSSAEPSVASHNRSLQRTA